MSGILGVYFIYLCFVWHHLETLPDLVAGYLTSLLSIVYHLFTIKCLELQNCTARRRSSDRNVAEYNDKLFCTWRLLDNFGSATYLLFNVSKTQSSVWEIGCWRSGLTKNVCHFVWPNKEAITGSLLSGCQSIAKGRVIPRLWHSQDAQLQETLSSSEFHFDWHR